MPSSFALGARFVRLVGRLVKSGRYNSKSEVIRAGLRLLEAQEQARAAQIEELRRAFREGIESGPRMPAEEVFDRLEAKYTKLIKRRA